MTSCYRLILQQEVSFFTVHFLGYSPKSRTALFVVLSEDFRELLFPDDPGAQLAGFFNSPPVNLEIPG